MQLDIFATSDPEAADLRTTATPGLAEAWAQVGGPQEWQALTLGEVLVLWERLYDEFIAVLDGPIQEARGFCEEHKRQAGKGGPVARKFYQREYERLVLAQQQLRATVENRFSDNLLFVFGLAKAALVAAGLSEEDAEDGHEFFNEVVQRPEPGDLDKLLPTLMQDLAAEYLRLQK